MSNVLTPGLFTNGIYVPINNHQSTIHKVSVDRWSQNLYIPNQQSRIGITRLAPGTGNVMDKDMTRMRRILSYPNQLWRTDIALTTLLISLLLYICFLYPLGQLGSFRLLPTFFFSLILITGAITAFRNRIFRVLVFSWGVLAFILVWVRYLFPNQTFIFIATCLGLFFLVLLASLILGQTFREGPTTSHRIMGAVAAYLLIGMIWSLAYYLVALWIPEAFNIQGSVTPGDRESLQSKLFYFSFVTLTTLGYGDIVAVHPTVRTLVILEGVLGQLYPAILIARLVSLQVQPNQKA